MPTQNARVAIYARQSLAKDDLAIKRQVEACKQFCQARGWTVVAVYDADNSVSAFAKDRSDFSRMLADATSGRFDIILAWALDRLTRSGKDTENLIKLSETHGVRVATVSGDLDMTNDQGRLVGRILTAVNQGEGERKAARQKLAHEQRATEGRLWAGGHRPLGYTTAGTIVPGEADKIREAYELILSGGSIRAVVRVWNDAGLRTARGNPWAPHSVRAVLLAPRNAGLSSLKGEIVGKGQWAEIVSEDTFYAVQAILTDPARNTSPGPTRTYLLSGLATCGHCGELIIAGGTSRRGGKTYRCGGRKHLIRRVEPVDHHVEQMIAARLRRPDLADLLAETAPDLGPLHSEATALRHRIDALAGDLDIDEATLAKRDRALRNKLAEVQERIAEASRTSVLADLVAAADPGLAFLEMDDLDRKRAIIGELATVTIYSPGQGAKRFDPASVAVVPRKRV